MKTGNKIRKPLTEEQVQALRGALSGHPLEAILTLALVTGLRRDELLALKWRDVNLDTHVLLVLDAKTRAISSLHLPEVVTKMLEQHRQRQMEAGEKAGLTWANLDLVFPDPHGEPLKPHHLVKGLSAIVEQAELPRISFHDLRRHVKNQELAKREVSKG